MTTPRTQAWISPSGLKLDVFVPFLGKYHRPVSGRCCQTCTPRSWDGFYPEDLAALGFRDASRVTEADTRFRGWLVRRVCGFLAAWEWKIPAESPGELLARVCSSRRWVGAAGGAGGAGPSPGDPLGTQRGSLRPTTGLPGAPLPCCPQGAGRCLWPGAWLRRGRGIPAALEGGGLPDPGGNPGPALPSAAEAVPLAAPQAPDPPVPGRAAAPGAAGDGAASCQDGREPARALPAPGTPGIHPGIPCLQPEVPLVFLCSHQSPLDGPLLSFLLLSQGIGLPRVAVSPAAGPRLRSLLQRLGGIFLPSGMAPARSARDEGLPGAVLDAVGAVRADRSPWSAREVLAAPSTPSLSPVRPGGAAEPPAPGAVPGGALGCPAAGGARPALAAAPAAGAAGRRRARRAAGARGHHLRPGSRQSGAGRSAPSAPRGRLVSPGGIPGPALPAPWLCPGGFLSALLLTGIFGQQPGQASPDGEPSRAAAASHHPGQAVRSRAPGGRVPLGSLLPALSSPLSSRLQPAGCGDRGDFGSHFGDRRGDFGDGAGAARAERFQSLLRRHSRGNHCSAAAPQAPGGGRRVPSPLPSGQHSRWDSPSPEGSIPGGIPPAPRAAFPAGSRCSAGAAAAPADVGFLGAAGAAAAAGPGRGLLGAAAGAGGAQPAPAAAPPGPPRRRGPGSAGLAGGGRPAPPGRGGRGRLCHPCPAAGGAANPGAALQPHQDRAEPGRAAPQDPGAAAAAAPHPAGAPGGDTGLAWHPQPCWGSGWGQGCGLSHRAGLSPLCCVPSPASLPTATAWTSWTSSSWGGCWRRRRPRVSAGAVTWPRGAAGGDLPWASSPMTATATASTASPSSATSSASPRASPASSCSSAAC
ncbi:collagen alpha-1(I) chain-like isoform X2 [Motacilla alba alba]|uniref:collagen alpha-1(I) chain-like isoform X2 n=1 Tax=Motacilla alba alba TaxID=1094192 RepID=UPI0018D5551E|nr:collagen alpha-1(I) chain-like isoform X2 [Motacilla alba alba]